MQRKLIRASCGAFAAVLVIMWVASCTRGYSADASKSEVRPSSVASDKEWDSLLRDAGRAKDGVVLEARPLTDPATAGGPVSIVLSIKNVGEREVRVAFFRPRTPIATIRDSAGRPVNLTEKGLQFYSFKSSGSISGGYLAPGQTPGETADLVLRLDEYFDLSKPGRYTVLMTEYLGGDVKGALTAKPVVLDVRPSP
jgi:hypothetical protein